MSLFWKIVDTLDPEPQKAQVIIGLGPGAGAGTRGLDPASLPIPGSAGLPGVTEAVLVLATSPRTCRETVLRLSQLGVSQLHAIYPQAHRGPCSTATWT